MKRSTVIGLGAILVAASGSGSAYGAPPSGFPTKWTPTKGYLVGQERPQQGLQVIHFISLIKARNGTTAAYYVSIKERRVTGGTVRCGGKTAGGPYTSDVRGNAGSGWFGVDNFGGTAQLKITRVVQVASDPTGPPSCSEVSGTWIGTTGPLRGSSGTFKEATDGTLTFR